MDPTLSSPGEDSEDILSPEGEIDFTPAPTHDAPGLWYDADAPTQPFQEVEDASVEFVYRPITLSILGIALFVMAYVAMSQDVLQEGRDKRRVGAYASIAAFLTFSMLQFRDGPFVRPFPAFWRIVLGINVLYSLALVFLLFQDLDSARQMMLYLDSSLGVPPLEKSYAEDCSLTTDNIASGIDIFFVAHFLGWFGKALILRDSWACWILSISFELAEYSFQHQLANFKECWWDHWILDVLMANWFGTYVGMRVAHFLQVKPYRWRGIQQARGVRNKARRVMSQFSPHEYTSFKWEGTASFQHYISFLLLLTIFLAAELTPFYLKTLLWMAPEHPFVTMRLVFVFLCALPAVRELYQYTNDHGEVRRMGQHVWVLTATIATEVLIIFKWGRGVFTAPLPQAVKWGWALGGTLLVLYPAIKFGIPAARRYIRKQERRRTKNKSQ